MFAAIHARQVTLAAHHRGPRTAPVGGARRRSNQPPIGRSPVKHLVRTVYVCLTLRAGRLRRVCFPRPPESPRRAGRGSGAFAGYYLATVPVRVCSRIQAFGSPVRRRRGSVGDPCPDAQVWTHRVRAVPRGNRVRRLRAYGGEHTTNCALSAQGASCPQQRAIAAAAGKYRESYCLPAAEWPVCGGWLARGLALKVYT